MAAESTSNVFGEFIADFLQPSTSYNHDIEATIDQILASEFSLDAFLSDEVEGVEPNTDPTLDNAHSPAPIAGAAVDRLPSPVQCSTVRVSVPVPVPVPVHVQNETAHSSPTPSVDAFAVATSADVQRLVEKNNNKNTLKTTITWVNRFDNWRKARNIIYKLEDIPQQDLDGVLQQFFAEIRKKDGSEYEPESLRTMLSALDRFLRDQGKQCRILKDEQFRNARKVLNGKAIELREKGMGKRKNKADALSDEEEEKLWDTGVLGGKNPKSLNYTVFYVLSQQYGTRGCQEHHQLQIEHLKLVRDTTTGKTVSIEWVEGPTKTRPGGLNKKDRRLPQKMFAHGGTRCPVKLLERLISKRPTALRCSGPLYLRPLETPREDIWYSTQPVGVRKIDTYMKEIAKLAGLHSSNKKITNHSIRKTTVCKLKKAGVSNDRIAAITGHHNEQSLRDYTEADEVEHMQLSSILSNTGMVSTPSPTVHELNTHKEPTPQFNFSNCNVYFGSTSSSMTCTQVNPAAKKRRVIIDSDSE